jgi:hypothetical protein
VEEPVVGAPWHQWERGGSAHGVGGMPGKRRRELQLGLEEGGARGSVAGGGGGGARHVGRSTGWAEGHWARRMNRLVGRLGRLGRN